MKRMLIYLIFISTIVAFQCHGFAESQQPGMGNSRIQKIFLQAQILSEGDSLARQGKYDEAIAKFNEAMSPECINEEHDKVEPQFRIIRAHKRQGQLKLALQEHTEWGYGKYSKYDKIVEEHLELLALVKSAESKDKQPIYDQIALIKDKYKRVLPPYGYAIAFSSIPIGDLIHLYDYVHDYDAGISFMNEVIKYLVKNGYPQDIGRQKILRDYTRVKQAWELDKKTGQHGHLQEVIRTSDVISW